MGMAGTWTAYRATCRAALRQIAGALLCALLLAPSVVPILAGTLYEDDTATCCCKGVCHCKRCRRHQTGTAPLTNGPAVAAAYSTCPCCPDVPTSLFSLQYLDHAAHAFGAEIVAHPTGVAQTEARLRFTSIRVRQKRGPPAHSLV